MTSVTDLFTTYQFIKRLVTPFKQWKAYKLGIIDGSGKVLRKRETLKKPEEKAAWGHFDIMLCNLKKLLAKVPGGSSMLGSAAAGYLLMKEGRDEQLLDEGYLKERLNHYINLVEQESAEGAGTVLPVSSEVPANKMGAGKVATFDPVLGGQTKKTLRRKKPI
jgi:hypothetical protein